MERLRIDSHQDDSTSQQPLHELRSPVDPYRHESERSLKVERITQVDVKDEQFEADQKKCCFWYMSKRRRIVFIIVSVLSVLLITALLVIFVGGKAYAQKLANQVELSINYIDLKHVEPNVDTKTLDVEFGVHLQYDGPLDAKLDESIAQLEYDGKQFGSVTIPPQHLPKGAQAFDVVVRTNAEITDGAVLSDMSKALLSKKEIRLKAIAEAKVHALGLSFSGIQVDRELTVKGLDNFASPAPVVNKIHMKECGADAYKILINATIDNISQLGLNGIGLLNLTVYYDHSYLGHALSTRPEDGLPRGKNAQEFEITVANTPTMQPVMMSMGLALFTRSKAHFYITGENPYATQVHVLKDAVRNINMSIVYTDGMSKVQLDPRTCDLTKLAGGLF